MMSLTGNGLMVAWGARCSGFSGWVCGLWVEVGCSGFLEVDGFARRAIGAWAAWGRELEANRRAAVVFHWDHRHRQVRAEGQVELLSDAENDAYFITRAWQSRLGAWASEQSQPVESREALARNVTAAARRFGIPYQGPGSAEPDDVAVEIPRPPHWGGYRLRADAVELWVEGEFRIHDRARWTRSLPDRSIAGSDTPWSVTRLQP